MENYEEVQVDEETKQEKEKQKEQENISKREPGLNHLEYDEDKERESGPLIHNNIFMKFDPKRTAHKKALKARTIKPPSMIAKPKPEKVELLHTRDTSPTKSRDDENSARKRTLSSQGNKEVNVESDSLSKKSEQAFSGLEEDLPKEDSEGKREEAKESYTMTPPTGGSFVNQIPDSDATNLTNQAEKEESKSLNDEIFLKKESSNPSLKTLDPVDSSAKEDQSPTLKVTEEGESAEVSQRKDTIRVLSEFDAAGKGTNLTLDKMLARNAVKGRKTSMDDKKEEIPQKPHSMGEIRKSETRDLSKIHVPEDSLDAFDTQDQYAHEADPNINVNDCFVVTQNPLISSYKVKITDVVPCPNLTKYLYDTETGKKTYEPTLVKVTILIYLFFYLSSTHLLNTF